MCDTQADRKSFEAIRQHVFAFFKLCFVLRNMHFLCPPCVLTQPAFCPPQFPKLSKLPFPGKKTFNNLSRQFLEQRRSQLNEFLQRILHVDVLSVNRGLREMMLHFLEPGLYEKEKKQFARTVSAPLALATQLCPPVGEALH